MVRTNPVTALANVIADRYIAPHVQAQLDRYADARIATRAANRLAMSAYRGPSRGVSLYGRTPQSIRVRRRRVLLRRVRRSTARRGLRRRVSRKAAVKARRMTGRVFSTNMYRRRFKRMRRFNQGKLALQSRLQGGATLPWQTYARFVWRASCETSTCAANPYQTQVADPLADRTFILNQLHKRVALAAQEGLQVTPTWWNVMSSLYEKYLVLGCKFDVTITPTTFPKRLIHSSWDDVNPTNTPTARVLPLNVKSGYWYLRVRYIRASGPTGTELESVGHPIDFTARPPQAGSGSALDVDNKTEQLWPSLREFLADPTVTWKKDTTFVRRKIQVHTQMPIDPQNNSGVGLDFPGLDNKVSYEIEANTRPVRLSVGFSARKHFGVNPRREVPYTAFSGIDQLHPNQCFFVRVGYVAFDENDNVTYSVPLSRNDNVTMEYNMQYYCALREPRVGPYDQPMLPEGQAKASLEGVLGEDDIENESDEEFIESLLPEEAVEEGGEETKE